MVCLQVRQSGGLLESVDEDKDIVHTNPDHHKDGDDVQKSNGFNLCKIET